MRERRHHARQLLLPLFLEIEEGAEVARHRDDFLRVGGDRGGRAVDPVDTAARRAPRGGGLVGPREEAAQGCEERGHRPRSVSAV